MSGQGRNRTSFARNRNESDATSDDKWHPPRPLKGTLSMLFSFILIAARSKRSFQSRDSRD